VQPGISKSNLLKSDNSCLAAASPNYWAILAEPAEPISPDIPEPTPTHIHNANHHHTQPKEVSWKDQIKRQGGDFHYYSTWRFKEIKAKAKRAKAEARASALADAKAKNHRRVDRWGRTKAEHDKVWKSKPVGILKPSSYDAAAQQRRGKRDRYVPTVTPPTPPTQMVVNHAPLSISKGQQPMAIPATPPTTSPLTRLSDRFKATWNDAANTAATLVRTVIPSGLLDSGATGHFGPENGGLDPTGEASSKLVGLADGTPVQATEKGKLPMSNLRDEVREGDIIPGLKNTLVSVSKFADEGYVTIFQPGGRGVEIYDQQNVRIVVSGEAALRGWRDQKSGLWRVPLTEDAQINSAESVELSMPQLREVVNNIYDLPSIEQAIRFTHACIGFPTKATWLKAIRRGNFVGWPLLTVENVHKYFPESDETQKGHMNQQRQGVRSTKTKATDFEEPDKSLTIGKKEKDVFIKVIDARELNGTIYTDQTGGFPITSSRGNKYVMVMVQIDSNVILVEAMKNKTDKEMQRAYLQLLKRVQQTGMEIKKHVLDNEVSEEMKDLIRDTCKLELVPPGCHRRNIAEVAIKTFKQHFISILSGVDDSFPMKLWDRLLLQAELTLNLLRQSNTTPTISAYAHLYGPFDYNRMPLAPLGCPVQIHEPPAKRGTWNHHCKAGWYLGTSKEHYRSHNIYVKATRGERISETVFFKHKYITNPSLTHGDMVIKAAQDLCKTLEQKPNHKGDAKLRGLKELSEIFLEMAENEPNATWEREYVPKIPPAMKVSSPRVKESPPPPRVPTVSPISNPTHFFPPEVRIDAPSTPIRASPARLRVDTTGSTSTDEDGTSTPLQLVSQQFSPPSTPTASPPNNRKAHPMLSKRRHRRRAS
jgi:hypothetical protein